MKKTPKLNIMKTEIIHHLDNNFPNGISKTEKITKLFGIVLWRKTYHYPKLEYYEVELRF